MVDQKRFDIIIAGAGAAGLSLLWRILKSPLLKNHQILLVDESFKPTNDKTWCFWEDVELPDNNLIHHSWDKLRVNIGGKSYTEMLINFQYKCLKSEDYSGYILNQAKKNDQVTFLESDVEGFSSGSDSGQIHTSDGEYESNKIFQSVLKPPNYENLKVDISLKQHFLGWEIECNQDLFDANTPTFMDFDVPQMNGTSFIYLLPFSKRKALVEYTIFSDHLLEKELYRKQIKDYLKDTYTIKRSDFTVVREEFGAIPMEDRRYPPKYCDFVWNIGTVGGLAKPSTGYVFNRIQKHTSTIVKALETNSGISKYPLSSFRFRVYDLMMLYLLAYEKKNALNVFECLFKKNNLDDVLRFLSEESSIAQELSIFSKMPYMPFFRSIYKMSHRIFTGA